MTRYMIDVSIFFHDVDGKVFSSVNVFFGTKATA